MELTGAFPPAASMNGVWSLKVRPSFSESPSCNSPDDNPAEFDLLPSFPIGRPPRVTNYDSIALCDDVLYGDVNIRESLECRCEISFRAFGAKGKARRH